MARPTISRRLLFFGFVLLGAASGFFIGSLSHALAAPNSKGDGVQHNTLIVLVDDLNAAQPSLEGVWLAAEVGGSDEISWMPIYPKPLNENSNYSQTHSAITLDSVDPANVGYMAPVREAGIWFDETFVIDGSGLAMISGLSGAQLTRLPNAWDEPQGALQQQISLLNSLCSFNWSDGRALDQLLALIPSHLQTTLSLFDLIARWDQWSQVGFGMSCTHQWAE